MTCAFAYDTSTSSHRSDCALPPLKEGVFLLRVYDGDGAEVGRGSYHFDVFRCPPTYSLGSDDACACDAGYFNAGLECAPCRAGFISTTRSATKCDECAFPETSNAQRTACTDCVSTYYRDERGCQPCPEGVSCSEGSQISDWRLNPGYWRASETAVEVFPCRYATMSCPGTGKMLNSTTSNATYCAVGFEGPLCSECSNNYFMTWSGKGCEKCAEGKSHTPTIGLSVLLLFFGALAVAWCYLKRRNFLSAETTKRVDDFVWVGEVKLTIIFFTSQVISQFCVISSGTGEDSGRYPEPAAT